MIAVDGVVGDEVTSCRQQVRGERVGGRCIPGLDDEVGVGIVNDRVVEFGTFEIDGGLKLECCPPVGERCTALLIGHVNGSAHALTDGKIPVSIGMIAV